MLKFLSAVLLPLFLLKIRSVRILDTVVWSGHCFGRSLLPGPWDTIELTLIVGFVCPFVVFVDPTYLGATIVVVCLTILNLSLCRIPALLPSVLMFCVHFR